MEPENVSSRPHAIGDRMPSYGMRGSRKIRQGWGYRSYFFLSSAYFTVGRTDIRREAIGPEGSY